jgi:hypothetical protein
MTDDVSDELAELIGFDDLELVIKIIENRAAVVKEVRAIKCTHNLQAEISQLSQLPIDEVVKQDSSASRQKGGKVVEGEIIHRGLFLLQLLDANTLF